MSSVDIMLVWIDTSVTSGSSIQRRSPGRRWSRRAKVRVPDGDSAAACWETASSSSEEPGELRPDGTVVSVTDTTACKNST
ncbi:hypothetical protein cypCar_00030398 [Cyprinus carpio]|nr:hypothetical protein cypCar_00030398 [Cyprinus carpio]